MRNKIMLNKYLEAASMLLAMSLPVLWVVLIAKSFNMIKYI